jgi:DNA polymerase elongation subunit (family B)
MSTLIFDIETIGEDFAALDETSQNVLTRWIKKDTSSEEQYQHSLESVKNGLGFSPLTGEIVVIGVMDAERERGVVYYQAPGEENEDFEENGIIFKQKTEAEMLECFWQGILKYSTLVSFNGRCFDVPFLMLRSAIHKVRPSKNLIANRYLNSQRDRIKHVDLLDQLSFYGAMWRKPSLHIACRAFGIKSPKADGVSGDDVMGLFKEKKFLDIAKYNVGDLVATKELYECWRDYLNV